MRTRYKILLALVFSISAVASLYFMQDKPVKNGFNRGPVYRVKPLDSLELKYNYWYINRLDSNRIYFGNTIARLNLFSCGYNLQDTLYQRLPAPDDSREQLEWLRKEISEKIKPADRGFGMDGYVVKDIPAGRILYTYYYRNSFVGLDTALQLLYTGKLIDTNTVAKIEVTEYKESELCWARFMAAPAVVVNKRGYADSGWFYNHSGLAGDNELLEGFKAHEVLDVYRLDNRKYSHSIYLPKYKKQDLTNFAVRGNLIIALYGKYLLSFSIQ
ncbi:hypothetical protein [Pedobacter africanus]|uniref:Uncharacterized protein n=1 Tax=Pedobacter africanus TaxID=151894 RepID=A0A1W2B0K8_9SPHI|nr:hypothetical protein [Pedobacter africanus]SMC66252.1 hypothetical protein SAMN04488524_1806 [Pedobacter africanus]